MMEDPLVSNEGPTFVLKVCIDNQILAFSLQIYHLTGEVKVACTLIISIYT